jgi:2-hydroxychromene-2-carboxylate isomerase
MHAASRTVNARVCGALLAGFAACYARRMPAFDFFYDLGSPYSYLASTQLDGLCARTGAVATLYPVTLGGMRKELGTQMPSAPQLKYMSTDVKRWAERYGVPMAIPPSFPARTIQALRCCAAAADEGKGREAMQALFHAYWGDLEDISNPKVIKAALDTRGLDGAALLARSEEPEVKELLKRNTDLALLRGVFGVPMIFIGERSFWGNDRLEFVEQALRALAREEGNR